MEIKFYPNNSLDDINILSIALTSINAKQRHIGILYTDSGNTEKLLHFAWYKKLRNDNPKDKYIWYDIALDEINKITLSAWCEVIFHANQNNIPYDINMYGTSFDETGEFQKTQTYSGLTCATFVMQVFHSHGLKIIDLANWPIREEDKTWQFNIAKTLLEEIPLINRAPYLKTKLQEIMLGVQRFRPEEVAAAAILEDPPHQQDSVQETSQELVQALSEI